MGTPHKHAAVIKAWADGAEIEWRDPYSKDHKWSALGGCEPSWWEKFEYRVKPEPHKWQKEIDAAKAGMVIQYRTPKGVWWDWPGALMCPPEKWSNEFEFRIKPVQVVRYGTAREFSKSSVEVGVERMVTDNLKLTFEDGKLVAAEVI